MGSNILGNIYTTHPIRIFSMFHTFFRRINHVEPDLSRLRQGLGGPAAGIGLDAHAAGGLSLGKGEEVGISFGGSIGFSMAMVFNDRFSWDFLPYKHYIKWMVYTGHSNQNDLKWMIGGYPNSWMVYKGKSQTKMDDGMGYPYDSGNLHICRIRGC